VGFGQGPAGIGRPPAYGLAHQARIRLFRDVLRCPDALFLDGTISSLHSTKLNRSDFRMDLGPMLGVTEPVAK
jgi:uncharacterized protein YigE (DUF2233 family)